MYFLLGLLSHLPKITLTGFSLLGELPEQTV